VCPSRIVHCNIGVASASQRPCQRLSCPALVSTPDSLVPWGRSEQRATPVHRAEDRTGCALPLSHALLSCPLAPVLLCSVSFVLTGHRKAAKGKHSSRGRRKGKGSRSQQDGGGQWHQLPGGLCVSCAAGSRRVAFVCLRPPVSSLLLVPASPKRPTIDSHGLRTIRSAHSNEEEQRSSKHWRQRNAVLQDSDPAASLVQ
jgi:hypothetical protein